MNYPALLLRMMTAILIGYLLVTSVACKKKDPCKNTTCLNGGTCIEGKCQCPDGYYGDGCQSFKSPFPGNWAGEICHGDPVALIVRETDTPQKMSLSFYYMRQWHPLKGKLTARDTILIERQRLVIGGSFPALYMYGWIASKGNDVVYDYKFEWNAEPNINPIDSCKGIYIRD